MSISNCGSDERGKYSGGQAGDQTGKEYCVRAWYNRPWKCVLRHPDAKIGEKLATVSKNAAKNDNIGYDQGQRMTYSVELKAVNWSPKNIKKKCEADCSSSTLANVVAVGHKLGIEKLKKINMSGTTSTLRKQLKDVGFIVLDDQKYLTSDAYLLPGDVLLNDGHHVAVNLTKGSKAGSVSTNTSSKKCPYSEPSKTLAKGSMGDGVKWVQWHLNVLLANGVISATYNGEKIKKLTIDGDWGVRTTAVFNSFQRKYPATGTNGIPDGKCGQNSRKKLKSLVV